VFCWGFLFSHLAIIVLTINQVLWLKFLSFHRITYSPPPSRCSQQSGAPADRWSSPRVARRLCGRPLALATVGSPDSPVHHRTVRWIIATSPFPFPESDEFVADDSLDSPVHHRTVRWIIATSPFPFPESDEFVADDSPDSLVHHRTVRWFLAVRHRRFPRAALSPETSLAHRIVRCARLNWIWLHRARSFWFLFSLFLALR
jgi:hypothetical protein